MVMTSGFVNFNFTEFVRIVDQTCLFLQLFFYFTGKSTWAMNYAKIHPSKKYLILETDSIIDKMRVQGVHRKNNFFGNMSRISR